MSPTEGFAPVLEYSALLSKFQRPWMIAGGWAIDFFLERVTREHQDVDVAILRADQGEIRAQLRGWEFEKIVKGRREPWRFGEWLDPPVHEVHGVRSEGVPRAIEILLNESSGDNWVFRRDSRITRQLSEVLCRTPEGVPFLAPEVALLYKAKDPKPKDEEDFTRAGPRLEAERRLWLRHALETAHPGHPWVARL